MGFGYKAGFLGSKDFKILSSNCQERFQHGLCKSSGDQKDKLKLKASSKAHIIITSMLSLSTHASLQPARPHHTARSQAVSHTGCQSHRLSVAGHHLLSVHHKQRPVSMATLHGHHPTAPEPTWGQAATAPCYLAAPSLASALALKWWQKQLAFHECLLPRLAHCSAAFVTVLALGRPKTHSWVWLGQSHVGLICSETELAAASLNQIISTPLSLPQTTTVNIHKPALRHR